MRTNPAVDQKIRLSYNKTYSKQKEPEMLTVTQARDQCARLHALDTMEPEDVYQQVAEDNGMEVEELYELLESDAEL